MTSFKNILANIILLAAGMTLIIGWFKTSSFEMGCSVPWETSKELIMFYGVLLLGLGTGIRISD